VEDLKLKLPYLLIFLPIAFVAQGAPASESNCVPTILPLTYVAKIPGKCTRTNYSENGKPAACKGLVNTGFRNGRVNFAFELDSGTLMMFGGGKDRQPKPDEYTLELDRIGIAGKKYQGAGECQMRGDILKAALITCNFKTTGKSFKMEFQSNGKPQWTNFCPPNN